MFLPNWTQKSSQIIQRLRQSSVLKICVKTKNEAEFLRQWIEHHAKIVGYENLIVADNGSDDEATLELYSEYQDKVTIFRFDGSHNEIHWSPRFSDLFAIIQRTSKFFAFIDVDERLVSIDSERWDASRSLIEVLSTENLIYATTWLINAPASYSIFTLLDTERRPILKNNLAWGKPILPSHLVGVQSGIHNVQFKNYGFAFGTKPRLFLLHLTQFPKQRIAANRNKLLSRRLIDGSESNEEIAKFDFSSQPDPSALRFQAEIKHMISLSVKDEDIWSANHNLLELCTSGAIRFSCEQARAVFQQYNNEADHHLERMTS